MSLRSFFARIVAQPRSWFRAVVRRNELEMEMEAELSCHLKNLTADLIRAGHSPQEAARRARVALGASTVHKEGMRASLGLRWWDEFWGDLRYGARILRKGPGFTVIAVASLALAIGANTTIFSVAKGVLYDRLGAPHPERLRVLGWNGDEHAAVHSYWSSFDASAVGMKSECFSYPIFKELEAHNQTLDGVFAFKDFGLTAGIRGKAQPVRAEMISGNYYAVLGVRPQLGRAIQPGDEGAPGAGAVVVISDGLWQSEFGRSQAVLGQTITVNQTSLTIVGVNPRGFTGAQSVQQSPELFIPLTMQPLVKPWGRKQSSLLTAADNWWLEVMGRVKPGTKETEIRAALDVELAAAVHGTMKVKANETIPRMVLADGSRGLHQLDYSFKKPVNVLLVLVGMVLLLACANIANLLLARGAHRQREMSVRLAMGAARGRVMRQMLTESLLLAAMGGLGGLLLGYLGRNVLPKLMIHDWGRDPIEIHFDWGVFGFTAAVTLLTGLLFGLAPAWSAARSEVSSGLKEGAQTATRRRRGMGGKTLVGFQIALSTLLVIGAGLFLRTLTGLYSVDAGFRTDHLLLAEIDPPRARYPEGKDVALHQRLEQALSAVPGVEAVTVMDMPYLSGSMMTMSFMTEEESVDLSKAKSERNETVGNQFFSTLGIPMIEGRSFGPQDTASSQNVAVINQSLARTRFPHGNPVGQRFTTGDTKNPNWIQVVGVCADTRYSSLRENPPPQFFMPYVQQTEVGGLTYVIRTHVRPAAIMPALRQALAQIDRDLPMADVRTQQEQIDDTMSTERALAALAGGFGLLALALACVGIYGIMAYSVANRRNEIGIRMALGARPAQVRGMILRESTWLTVVGIVVGVGAALLLTRLVKSMLYGIQAYDPLTVAGGVLILLAVALAASWIPARRAARVQPMEALRHE
jgi:predicted permease